MDEVSRLIVRAQEGDREAFGKIYSIFYKRIYRYCQFNVGKIDAFDVCQETFLKAWKSLASFSLRKGGSFQAYLFKIARNLIIDASRKKSELKLAQYLDIESNEDLEGEINRDEDVKTMRLAISKLEGFERQIIILRYFEELTIYEVSKVVGINEGALRVRIHRILKKLKDIIEKND